MRRKNLFRFILENPWSVASLTFGVMALIPLFTDIHWIFIVPNAVSAVTFSKYAGYAGQDDSCRFLGASIGWTIIMLTALFLLFVIADAAFADRIIATVGQGFTGSIK